ncbi:MAG TPA: DUF192 domain-containing protein [Geobacteraceae bacterium]
MKLINTTKHCEIASKFKIAENIFTRMKGLLGKSSLAEGEGLLIRPCKGIHTFGMKFPIDAVFLDRNNRVIAVKTGLAPNRMTPVFFSAASVLELPSGTIVATATAIGDAIEIA